MSWLIRRNGSATLNPWNVFDRMMAEPFFRTDIEFAPPTGDVLALDVTEDDEFITVKANVPGFAKDEIQVEVNDDVLTINANKAEQCEESKGTVHRCERRCGSLARRVLLPSCVTERNAKAELREGVLTLRLPKSRENSPHRISIN